MDGRPAEPVDPVSVGNLPGDTLAKSVARATAKADHKPSYTKRNRPLNVKGVGKGAQQCKYDCTLPISLCNAAGDSVTLGSLGTPTISGSEIPVSWAFRRCARTEAFWIATPFSSISVDQATAICRRRS